MSRGLSTALLLAIASIALRLQFIDFPIGDHPDEKIIAGLAERAVATGKLTANWEGFPEIVWWSRPTYQFSPYTLLENGAALLWHRLARWPQTWEDQVRFARCFSVVMGGLAVFLCFIVAKAWFNDVRIALLAESFLAIAFLHVQDSCYGRVEAMLSVAILLAYWAAAGVMNRTTWARCLLLGVAIGFAVAVKYNAAPVTLLAVAALARRTPGEPGASATGVPSALRQANVDQTSALQPPTLPACLLAVFLGALVGFLLATPEVLLNPAPLLQGIQYEMAHYAEGHPPHQAFDASDNNARFWWTYFTRLGFGWTPTLAALGFLLLAVRRRGRDALFAFALLAAFAVLLVVKVRFERNAEILLGPACIAAARFLVSAWDAASNRLWRTLIRTAIVVGVVGNVVQHAVALVDFHHQQKRSSSPLHQIPITAREQNVLGIAVSSPPPDNWKDYPAILLYGNNEPFSQHGRAEWMERLKDWDVVVIEAPWYAAGYPFSTVESYHGPGFVLRASRKGGVP